MEPSEKPWFLVDEEKMKVKVQTPIDVMDEADSEEVELDPQVAALFEACRKDSDQEAIMLKIIKVLPRNTMQLAVTCPFCGEGKVEVSLKGDPVDTTCPNCEAWVHYRLGDG